MNWLRSKAYTDYFESLDQDGGFFYERWGDAPVHSIAAALLLKKEELHFFNDIAYYHVPFTHCPTGEKLRTDLRCHCNPKDNFDWKGYSCKFPFYGPIGCSNASNIKQVPRGTLTSTVSRSRKAGRTSRTRSGIQHWFPKYHVRLAVLYFLSLMTSSFSRSDKHSRSQGTHGQNLGGKRRIGMQHGM